MTRTLTFSVVMLFLTACATLDTGRNKDSSYMNVMYSGLMFKIPADPLVVAYLGGESDILTFEYSKEPGKYIGYTTDHDLTTGGCDPAIFFQKALSGEASKSDCNGEITSFNQVFSRGRETGTWSGTNQTFYYFISSGKRSSFVFFVSDDGTIKKMESDFLKKSDFRKSLSNYL